MPQLPPANSWQEFAIIIVGGVILFIIMQWFGWKLYPDYGITERSMRFASKYPKTALILLPLLLGGILVGTYYALIANIDECQAKGGELHWFKGTRCIFPDGSWQSSSAMEN